MPTYEVYARVVPMADRPGVVIIGSDLDASGSNATMEQFTAENESQALEIAFTGFFGQHGMKVSSPSKLGMQTSDAKRVVHVWNAERNQQLASEVDQQFCDVYIRQVGK